MTKALLLAVGILIACAGPAFAQSPNTAALVVSIQDQTGAVVHAPLVLHRPALAQAADVVARARSLKPDRLRQHLAHGRV